jgi:hypothetical protein
VVTRDWKGQERGERKKFNKGHQNTEWRNDFWFFFSTAGLVLVKTMYISK